MAPTHPKAQHVAPTALRLAFRATSAIAPALAARIAADLFCRPRPRRRRPPELELLSRARREDLTIRGHRLAVHRWGSGPIVLLHHGWSGDAAQMTALVDPLVAAGYEAVAVDGLAHGESAGRISTFVDMASDAIELVVASGGVHAIVGHSMGAMIAARVAATHPVAGLVFVAPPAEMRVYSQLFARAVDIPPAVHDRMIAGFERTYGIDWDDISAEALAPGRSEPCLLIYDTDDRDAPPDHAHRWIDAWAGPITVHETQGLGHRNVLRDAAVHAVCIDWLQGVREGPRPAGHGPRSEIDPSD